MALLAALVSLGFGARLFVFPVTDPVVMADAVIVLDDSGPAGLQEGLAVINAQGAAVLVIVRDASHADAATDRLCAGGATATVLCPDLPSDGRAQAKALGALIDAQGWRRVALVGARASMSRHAVLVTRCTTAVVLRRVPPTGRGAGTVVDAVAEAPRYLAALLFGQTC